MATLKVAWKDAVRGLSVPTGDPLTLVVAPPPREIVIRLDLDPTEARAADDTFKLVSSDGQYSQTKTVKDDLTPNDRFTDLRFDALKRGLEYSLECDPGDEGEPYLLFEKIPYAELVGLSQEKPAEAEAVEEGTLRLRIEIDPAEAKSKDDRVRLFSTDGAFEAVRTVKDDLVDGDGFVDLEFTGLDPSKDYSLEVDLGKEGGPELVFENVPCADLAHLSWMIPVEEDAPEEEAEGTLRVRVDVDPADARSLDDKVTLKATDGSWSQTKTVKDDLVPGDGATDLAFTGLPKDKAFTLEVDFGREGGPEVVFEDVPFEELGQLSWNVAPPDADGDASEEEETGELRVRLEIDPSDAKSRDDRFTLFSSDSSVKITKTVKDDQQPGDAFVDLVFDGLPKHLDYSLEIDLGDEGGRSLAFEKVPYAQLGEISWNVPVEEPAPPETTATELKLRVDLDPEDAPGWDDTFVLKSADGSYSQSRSIRDDLVPGDRFVDLLFTSLDPEQDYTLEVKLGAEAGSEVLFEEIPFVELRQLSENAPVAPVED